MSDIKHSFKKNLYTILILFILCLPLSQLLSADLTLEVAINRALYKTTRGGMIDGNLEVAQQYYSAKRINMYLPEISINGSLPSYSINESYRPYLDQFDRQLYEDRNLDFNSFIELNQTLFTGGKIKATANLVSTDNRYPNTQFPLDAKQFIDESSRSGFFNFELNQPLFRPSQVKNDLNDKKDDLEIARMTKIEEIAALKKEVSETYLKVLNLNLKTEITKDKLEKTKLQEQIDSLKFSDGVLSEEDLLISTSARLDAELEFFSTQIELEEQKRELTTLLDLDSDETLLLHQPEIKDHPNQKAGNHLVAGWEETVPVIKAKFQYSKSEREANYAASGHSLTGDLKASYSLGRQRIETEFFSDSLNSNILNEANIPTNGWSVALEFRLPLWDGGAGSAAVKAAKFSAEKARYDYTHTRRAAQAQIKSLINELDVSYQRLEIMNKQIGLANKRLDIAKDRKADGQISMLTLLESRIFYFESKQKYLDELTKYFLNRIELEGKFVS